MYSFVSTLEILPDEILLEICRYLSSTDVLYSLRNLNSRFNQTITVYRQHVVLRRVPFNQFEYLCRHILPDIGTSISSLTINANWTDLLAKRFYAHFKGRMSELFPKLEHLILVALDGSELYDYMESIVNLLFLKKLSVHDRYNVTEEYKHVLLEKVLSANENRFETILFNRHSESLSINSLTETIYFNIHHLNVHLQSGDDLRHLLKLIPNVRQMYIVIGKQTIDNSISFNGVRMNYLIDFQLESFYRPWILDEMISLIDQMPVIQRLSLDLFTKDPRLINGQQIVTLPLIQNLKYFTYAVDYTPDDELESTDDIIASWSSTSYRIACLPDDFKGHLFLHTIPYGFPYLDISSLFVKYMSKRDQGYMSCIQELLVFGASSIGETFVALENCRRVKDLTLEIEESSIEKPTVTKTVLPRLNRLHWLSIEGCPSDAHLVRSILDSAPKLCMLVVDLKLLLQLLDLIEEESCILLLEKRIKHLSIQIFDDTELTNINIYRLSSVFARVRHIIIELHTSDAPIENVILSCLNHFSEQQQLVSLIVRGFPTESMRENIRHWLIERTYLNEQIHPFATECDETEFKIWF